MTKHLWRVAALVALGLIAGCATSTGSARPEAATRAALGTPVAAPEIIAGQDVPAPAGATVLTVTGRITRPNHDGTLRLDLPTLEKLGLTQVHLYEPWVKQNLDFRGVWLADLLDVAGAGPGAASVHLVAQDDYVVDLTTAEVTAGGVLVATRAGDGSAIPPDRGGPTRLVFADGVATGTNPDRWIWSLKSIDVR
ncbi:molybdopterin-dependent oxidoreductase [Actinoplanes sp. NPDC049265]|uniref:molybdopterin-dependent oxidoreductase n=1 Tax=Actinoplanes sp. NPDC049265 TaxID=3363902 RepID=UPI00371F74AE